MKTTLGSTRIQRKQCSRVKTAFGIFTCAENISSRCHRLFGQPGVAAGSERSKWMFVLESNRITAGGSVLLKSSAKYAAGSKWRLATTC
jgi:hypothetical protein